MLKAPNCGRQIRELGNDEPGVHSVRCMKCMKCLKFVSEL